MVLTRILKSALTMCFSSGPLAMLGHSLCNYVIKKTEKKSDIRVVFCGKECRYIHRKRENNAVGFFGGYPILNLCPTVFQPPLRRGFTLKKR